MRISLDHAHIFASDLDATVAFFVSMFEAEVLWDEEAAGVRGVRLRIGRAFIHVYDQAPRLAKGGVVHHLGIETDDLEGLVTQMESRGFAFRNQVKSEPRFKYVMVAAPDNLLIELFECTEPVRWGLPPS
jgi:catechol 2,3-dioxygenase-like lactoylglutathione lyase family enzyme